MYKEKKTGYIVYETLDELINADVINVYEDENNYFFRLNSDEFFDNSAWKVDKKTNKVSYIDFIPLMMEVLVNKTIHEIDLSILKKRIA